MDFVEACVRELAWEYLFFVLGGSGGGKGFASAFGRFGGVGGLGRSFSGETGESFFPFVGGE